MQATSRYMALHEFQECIDSFGADFSRWPEECVGPARALIENDPEARLIYREALEITNLFTLSLSEKAPAGLMDRICTLAEQSSAPASKASKGTSLECKEESQTEYASGMFAQKHRQGA